MRIAHCAWESLHSISLGGVAVHVTELAAAQQTGGGGEPDPTVAAWGIESSD